MQLSSALCLFTARVEQRDGECVLTVPDQELELGALEAGETYRVGVYLDATPTPAVDGEASGAAGDEPPPRSRTAVSTRGTVGSGATDGTPDQPPVSEGERLSLQIEDVGDQGDGLARVGPGYVVFVPDTEVGQQPLVRVTTVRENFAFAEVVER